METPSVVRTDEYWLGRFAAMASDCEVLVDVDDERLARRVVGIAAAEARRIETKFSRYRDDNPVYRINHSEGLPVDVDDETALLLDFAARVYELSDGRFDVTSGVLRRAWTFDGSDNVPAPRQVEALLPYVGWNKVSWKSPRVTVPRGMEIDLGGIGKEYAVDRAARLVTEMTSAGVVVNLGGDLAVTGPRPGGVAWRVGIERPDARRGVAGAIEIRQGAIATSGDARRYLEKDGVRYSHILDPRTGWPVRGAPRSVTVLAGSCTEAGMLATMALLEGPGAEVFLNAQAARFWCVW
jgi:thiamine biosynthesis lipoprotein